MGKRKLHGQTYYQCDWTAFPMRLSNCYMPFWNAENKLVKRGSYCNWESVLAHANYMRISGDEKMTEDQYQRVLQYVNNIIGPLPDRLDEYHYSFLEHFKDEPEMWAPLSSQPRNWSLDEYHKKCCVATVDVTAVKIRPISGGDPEPMEVILQPSDGSFNFDSYLTRPYMLNGPEHTVAQFQSTRKGRAPKDELTVYHWPFKNGLPYNTMASNIFKMQIYGDVLLVQQSKETCWTMRDRFTNFTKQRFDELFTKKRKKEETEVGALTPSEFSQMKTEMQVSLNGYEAGVSAEAEVPGQKKGAKMPKVTGKELMGVAVALGIGPPPVVRQATSVLVGA